MNLILFSPEDLSRPLPLSDPRARHLVNILKRTPGDTFDAGLINGPRGKATLATLTPDALTFTFAPTHDPVAPAPIAVIVGLPRPQTARDILRDLTTLGVASIDFVTTEKTDPNYAHSSLWSSGEWRRHTIAGAEQAFDTCLPRITHTHTLSHLFATLPGSSTRLALDNYESPRALGSLENLSPPVTLAIGPERGWSARERDALRAAHFTFVHLGSRVLRTESACLAAVTLIRAKLGLM